MNDVGERPVPSQRRLQRPADFTGDRLDSFMAVFLRHGLPGLLLGLLFLLYPAARELLAGSLNAAFEAPVTYGIGALAIVVGLNGYAAFIDRQWSPAKGGWVFYLGALSFWEEWVFRLALPVLITAAGASLMVGVIVSNLLFGLLHFFTLRWKWQWCVGAFLGGLAFANHFHEHHNLLAIVFLHWIATFINTPRLPGGRTNSNRSP